jgi:hypothetical protein
MRPAASALAVVILTAGLAPADAPSWQDVLRDRRQWWSLQPVHKRQFERKVIDIMQRALRPEP